jgi:hypothetical protein
LNDGHARTCSQNQLSGRSFLTRSVPPPIFRAGPALEQNTSDSIRQRKKINVEPTREE